VLAFGLICEAVTIYGHPAMIPYKIFIYIVTTKSLMTLYRGRGIHVQHFSKIRSMAEWPE